MFRFSKREKNNQTYTKTRQIQSIRRAFHRMLQMPLYNLEQAWKDYCQYENTINPNLSLKFIEELTKPYINMRTLAREIESFVKKIHKNHLPILPSTRKEDNFLFRSWINYIIYEEGNPLSIENKNFFIQRVSVCYEQALLVFPKWVQVWLGYINFFITMIESIQESQNSNNIINHLKVQIANLFQRATEIFLPDSALIYLTWAKFEEDFGTKDNVNFVFNKSLQSQMIDPTMIYVHMLAYRKKVEGISAARQCFKRAREDHRCGYQIYIAAASVEQFSSPEISLKILDLGLKKFGADFDYIKAYMKFIMNRPKYYDYRTCCEKLLSLDYVAKNQNVSNYVAKKYLKMDGFFGRLNSFRPLLKRLVSFDSISSSINFNKEFMFSNIYKNSFEYNGLKILDYTSTCSDQDISNHSNNENQNNSSSGKRIVPSVDQMVEFCPKPSSKNFPMIDSLFLVPGGRQKMPSALEKLLEIIPGINEFSGPYIYVDQLVSILDSNTPKKEYTSIMRNLSSFNKGLSRTPDPGLVYTIEKFAQNFKMSIANTDTLNNSGSKRNIGHSDIYNRRKKIK